MERSAIFKKPQLSSNIQQRIWLRGQDAQKVFKYSKNRFIWIKASWLVREVEKNCCQINAQQLLQFSRSSSLNWSKKVDIKTVSFISTRRATWIGFIKKPKWTKKIDICQNKRLKRVHCPVKVNILVWYIH